MDRIVALQKQVVDSTNKSAIDVYQQILRTRGYCSPALYQKFCQVANGKFMNYYIETLRNDANTFALLQIYYQRALIRNIFKENEPIGLSDASLACILIATENAQGHKQIQNGGFVAAYVDEFLGTLVAIFARKCPVATKWLKIDYKKKMLTQHAYLMICQITKHDDKSIFVKGVISDQSGTEYLLAEAEFSQLKASRFEKWEPISSTFKQIKDLENIIDETY